MASSRTAASAEAWAQRFEAAFAEELARSIPAAAGVTAALSGGVDSVVLLHLLRRCCARANASLQALHVNHGLSPHADAWERFCRRHCARRRVSFRAVRVHVAGNGANVEAEARAARYRAFATCGTPFLALAHHRDDQAETLLLNLLRGSGVYGLAGMPSRRPLSETPHAQVMLVRPLLGSGRGEIERYARLRRLSWIEDESNRDPRFARNFLRLEALPLLERRFPGSGEALARSAAHLADAASLLDQLAAADCAQIGEDGRLHVERLRALGEVRAANALRHYLARRGEPPPGLARTREMLRQLTLARRDAQPAIALRAATLRRFRGWIELVPQAAAAAPPSCVQWQGERRVALAANGALLAAPGRGAGVSAQRLAQAPVTIRWRQGGERIRIAGTGRRRTVKNLLREAGVVPWARARLPLLFCGEELVWVPFVGVAADYQAVAGERAWRFSWRPSPGSR
jgi:tRNA(Ile)-lysidine synthase